MSTYNALLERAQGIVPDLDEKEADLVVDLLSRVLDLEGPPPIPDPEDESYQRGVIKHSTTNRGIALAETWRKGPWRCVLIHSKSIPQARHKTRTLPDGSKVPIVDSASTTAQRRVVMACRHFKLDNPVGDCVVSITSNPTRTFMAWRRPSEAEARWSQELLGDVDNYAKTILDGLQKAGVIRNDRGVIEARVTKVDPWKGPAESLEEYQKNRLLAAAEEEVRPEEMEELRLDLGASKKLFNSLFPSARRRGRPVATGTERADQRAQLIEALKNGIGKAELDAMREKLGAPKTLLRGLNKLRLQGQRKRLLEAIKGGKSDKELEKLRVAVDATPSLLRRLRLRKGREAAEKAARNTKKKSGRS
jgi:Holliday junction resolvase RusA-like endonuclease